MKTSAVRMLLLLLALVCAGQVSGPLIGYVRDGRGHLRPVYGVSGAFVVGESIRHEVVAASFSGVAGLAKTDGALLVYRGGALAETLDAPRGSASFGFDAKGLPAWVRFADETCLAWRNQKAEQGSCPASESIVLPALPDLPEVVETIERMGEGWLAVHSKHGIWALRTDPEPKAYRLPEAAQ
jgi:hypothetical protein